MEKPTRSIPRSVKWLIIAYLVVGIPVQLIKYAHQYRSESAAEEWFNQASAAASTSWSQSDAIDWLQKHGFVSITKGEGVSSGQRGVEDQYLVVTGRTDLFDETTITCPASVIIDFIFETDQRFRCVEYHLWPFRAGG
jgi:hypothetical protein